MNADKPPGTSDGAKGDRPEVGGDVAASPPAFVPVNCFYCGKTFVEFENRFGIRWNGYRLWFHFGPCWTDGIGSLIGERFRKCGDIAAPSLVLGGVAARFSTALRAIIELDTGPDVESWGCDCCFRGLALGLARRALLEGGGASACPAKRPPVGDSGGSARPCPGGKPNWGCNGNGQASDHFHECPFLVEIHCECCDLCSQDCAWEV